MNDHVLESRERKNFRFSKSLTYLFKNWNLLTTNIEKTYEFELNIYTMK